MTIYELRRVLIGIGVTATPSEIADVLWLAMLISRDPAATIPPELSSNFATTETPIPTSSARVLPQAEPNLPVPQPIGPVPQRDDRQDSLHIRLPESTTTVKAVATSFTPVQAAVGPDLRDPLQLTRALRPLRSQKAVGDGVQVDEGATADLIAEQRLWLPVFAPAEEPGFDLALVIDSSDSMALWNGLIREFQSLCEHLGAFRDIRAWHLVTGRDGSPPKPALRGAAPTSTLRDPRELLDPSGRRLILVITDGVHPWWQPSGPLRSILAQWNTASPVAIVQPFPQRLWDRSAIRPALAEFRSNGPGHFTGRIIRPPRQQAATLQSPSDSVATIPILEITPLVLDRWARLVAGFDPAATLAAATLTGTLDNSRDHPPDGSEVSPTAPGPVDPADLVRAFRASISPAAYILAGYLSVVAPLSLPVMRLVLESMLPEAGSAELAEVFLGGLLRRLPSHFADSADGVTYGFPAGVREALQSTVTNSEALTLLDQVGTYLVRGQHSGRPFTAVLANPVGGDIMAAAEQYPPFARIAINVLQRIGGPFAKAALRITSDLPTAGSGDPIEGSFEPAAQKLTPVRRSTNEGDVVLRQRSQTRQPSLQAHRPWSPTQVRVADSWPTKRGQPVSVALSPTADRLALSVGERLSVSAISDRRSSGELLYQLPCALAPRLVWAPTGNKLAFRDAEGRCQILDLPGEVPVIDGQVQTELLGVASAIAFSPDGERLATLAPSLQGRLTLTLRGLRGEVLWKSTLTRPPTSAHRSEGVNLAWSPDGRFLACTTGASTAPKVWLVDSSDGHPVGQFGNHSDTVTGLAWIDDDWVLSASEDATLQLWRPDGSAPTAVVETSPAAGMIFVRELGTALIWSGEGELFAWSLEGNPAQLWQRNPPSRSVAAHFTRLAVSAVNGLLALVDAGATELVLISDWERTASAPASTTTYTNAKVVLLGDFGVGKSALAMVLAGAEFGATESTHGRRIWRLPATDESDASGGDREVLLWDPAGQPDYRILPQLHLGGAVVALIVFDSRSESTPLAGVYYWARAIRQAYPVGSSALITFLVAARTDRGGITVSSERIQQVMNDFALDGYFETSAKEATNTDLLRSRVLAAIDWERIPKIASTALFTEVKQFIVDQMSSGHLLMPLDDLSRAFQVAAPSSLELLQAELQLPDLSDAEAEEAYSAALNAVFEGCVARLESADLVKRLKFWDYVLLRPELLDAYASAIVNAARDEPDGLGDILESKVIELEFAIPSAARLPERRQERLLVLATLEELIQNELVLREQTEDGVQLVFPAAYRRDLPASEAPKGDGAVFRFEGPIDNVYATLIVRLTRSNRFTRIATWQSAARFAADTGQCTISLRTDSEGKAELWIGYDRVPSVLRAQFERFIHAHLTRWAIPGTVVRERQYSCPDDSTPFTPEQVEGVRNRGRMTIRCPVCERQVSLRDDYEPPTGADQSTAAMDRSADVGRKRSAATTVLRGKEEVSGFDVFLCHNWDDKPAVRELALKLRERGLRPWLDEWELRPGLPWQRVLEEQIQSIPAAAVIVGSTMDPWQDQELTAFMRQFVRRHCPVIPVLLPGVERPELPAFLDGMIWVDLATDDPDPLDQLEWGITGRVPGQ